ncbi:MAG: haloacid dehalogenase-like hydrolase [Verrucomicrobiaceae bacterium]|nr:haloacid dehalogenase-like hydrolase [Verrucomicrobiaceae bacterium]
MVGAMSSKRGYAFFDLDHTLLPHDTQALFCNYVLQQERWRTLLHVMFVPFALLKALRLVSTLRAKRAFMGYLWRMPHRKLQRYAAEFAQHSVLPWTYADVLSEVERHRNEGRVLVLNTASPDFYARDIAEILGFDHCVATKARLTDPLSWHPAIPVNNKHDEKIEAMRAEVPGVATLTADERNDHCYAYSDSAADLPLLEFGGNAVLVHPAPHLATLGIRREWGLMHPPRPYFSRVGDMLSVVRQILGLYPVAPEQK